MKEKKNSKKVCQITGRRPTTGGIVTYRGISKKAGGIGYQLVKVTKRKFRPNLQRIRVVLPTGEIKRMWVSAKAIKAGLVTKAIRGQSRLKAPTA